MLAVNVIHHRSRPRPSAVAGAIGALVLALLALPATADAQQGGTTAEAACPEAALDAEPFDDIAPEALHAEAIACVWAYGITSGQVIAGELRFSPRSTVTREQMASFVAQVLDLLPDEVYALPEPGDETLYDDAEEISDAHRANVRRLTRAGIVRGYGDGRFGPLFQVNREQMATFIATSIEAATGEELPREDAFEDLSGPHDVSVEKLAAIDVARGVGGDTYSPRLPIRREQMASFLARTLQHLVTEDVLEPLSFDPGTTAATLAVVDVEVARHDDFDRVTFTLEGDDREAGWRVRYVDEARSAGSGSLLAVDGEAVLQVTLTGMAVPPDLPQEVADRRWDEDVVEFGGEAIVELVNDSIFEGQQEVFVGTTGLLPFEVNRLEDPQRIYIDVSHPA